MYNQRKCMCFTVAATTKLPSRVDAVFGYSLKSTTITNLLLLPPHLLFTITIPRERSLRFGNILWLRNW
ncbi:hypothetical protein ACET3Z_017043 [Daucus carota]